MRELSNDQVRLLVNLLIEAASEHGEAGGEAAHLHGKQAEDNDLRRECMRARRDVARDALLIVLDVDPYEAPF